MPNEQDVYLITCTGQGDTEIYLVDRNTFDWINMNHNNVPKQVIESRKKANTEWDIKQTDEQIIEELNLVKGSSSSNDRALRLGDSFPLFWSVKEVVTYVKNNNLNIVGEYEGHIY